MLSSCTWRFFLAPPPVSILKQALSISLPIVSNPTEQPEFKETQPKDWCVAQCTGPGFQPPPNLPTSPTWENKHLCENPSVMFCDPRMKCHRIWPLWSHSCHSPDHTPASGLSPGFCWHATLSCAILYYSTGHCSLEQWPQKSLPHPKDQGILLSHSCGTWTLSHHLWFSSFTVQLEDCVPHEKSPGICIGIGIQQVLDTFAE
jgi:hypothetical protein